MIWVTGDTHGDFRRFSTRRFPQQKQMTRDDYVVICGDFGFWNDTPEERYWLDWLDRKNFTTLWVDGNHEHYGRLAEIPKEEWKGGLVQAIRPNVLRLCRGHIFHIDGRTCFVMGGAQSHDARVLLRPGENVSLRCRVLARRDILFRVEGESWWPEEMPSVAEFRQGLDELAWEDWVVDLMFTHCLPTVLQERLFPGRYPVNALTDYLERLHARVRFAQWYCGHYHCHAELPDEKTTILYEQILPIGSERT